MEAGKLQRSAKKNMTTQPETSTPVKFSSSPLNKGCLLEDKPFLLGLGKFSGANC